MDKVQCSAKICVLDELHEFWCSLPVGHTPPHRGEEAAYDDKALEAYLQGHGDNPNNRIVVTWE